jgi:hypothetical protein
MKVGKRIDTMRTLAFQIQTQKRGQSKKLKTKVEKTKTMRKAVIVLLMINPGKLAALFISTFLKWKSLKMPFQASIILVL